MGKVTIQENNRNQLHVDYDVSTIFIWDNKYQDAVLKNTTGGLFTFPAGTLLGRNSATGDVEALDSTVTTQGQNIPVGILAQAVEIVDTATAPVSMCVSGNVVEDKVVLGGTDTLDTVIALKRLRDRIGSDTVGVNLVSSTEMTSPDNS